jgi:uncharacterized protein YndB with AHSA1/START domain
MLDTPNTRSVTTEKHFAHPISAVWRAMTDSEWLSVWFFPNDIAPVEGHKFTIWSRPIERWDGEFKCRILAVEPEALLRFSWTGGHEELKGFGRYMDLVATWTIVSSADGGTDFTFLLEGLDSAPESDALTEIMRKGSESVLNSLVKRLPQLIEHES